MFINSILNERITSVTELNIAFHDCTIISLSASSWSPDVSYVKIGGGSFLGCCESPEHCA
jgi:hypothetical protein